ncbi:hypothetical protein [Holdemanella biformis]|uniref:hypothetical protein n=1 Tax=Holdemanella biformis TaxID=1735 RepID=UPI003079860A
MIRELQKADINKVADIWLDTNVTAHSLAGGKKDIAVYLVANENAIAFYEKLGMKKANDVMEYNHIEWTPFTVK